MSGGIPDNQSQATIRGRLARIRHAYSSVVVLPTRFPYETYDSVHHATRRGPTHPDTALYPNGEIELLGLVTLRSGFVSGRRHARVSSRRISTRARPYPTVRTTRANALGVSR